MYNISLFVEDEAHEDFLTAAAVRTRLLFSKPIDRAIDRLLSALHKRFQMWQQTEN